MNTLKEQQPVSDLPFTVHIFKENEMFVAYVPELDVSSCGETAETARRNVQDAVRGFLETTREIGTLAEILEEAGYRHEGNVWRAPEFVSLDRLTVNVR